MRALGRRAAARRTPPPQAGLPRDEAGSPLAETASAGARSGTRRDHLAALSIARAAPHLGRPAASRVVKISRPGSSVRRGGAAAPAVSIEDERLGALAERPARRQRRIVARSCRATAIASTSARCRPQPVIARPQLISRSAAPDEAVLRHRDLSVSAGPASPVTTALGRRARLREGHVPFTRSPAAARRRARHFRIARSCRSPLAIRPAAATGRAVACSPVCAQLECSRGRAARRSPASPARALRGGVPPRGAPPGRHGAIAHDHGADDGVVYVLPRPRSARSRACLTAVVSTTSSNSALSVAARTARNRRSLRDTDKRWDANRLDADRDAPSRAALREDEARTPAPA